MNTYIINVGTCVASFIDVFGEPLRSCHHFRQQSDIKTSPAASSALSFSFCCCFFCLIWRMDIITYYCRPMQWMCSFIRCLSIWSNNIRVVGGAIKREMRMRTRSVNNNSRRNKTYVDVWAMQLRAGAKCLLLLFFGINMREILSRDIMLMKRRWMNDLFSDPEKGSQRRSLHCHHHHAARAELRRD